MIEPVKIESVSRLNIGGRLLKIDPSAIKAEKANSSGNDSWLKSDLFFVSARTDREGVWVVHFLIATEDVSLDLFISYGQMADEWENKKMPDELLKMQLAYGEADVNPFFAQLI